MIQLKLRMLRVDIENGAAPVAVHAALHTNQETAKHFLLNT